ncbi:MAG: biopolymer transport protein ExbD [Verrucomicrobiales bacterium]|jgi:biopolymer transport protein ExbD
MSRKKKEAPVSFQITPMIDMTFLLLIFFMVTTTLTNQSVKMDINLPEAQSAVIPEDLSDREVINIDESGEYFISDTPVSKDEMAAHLKKQFVDFPPLKIYLRADASTPAKKITEFMEMATEAGAVNVIFGTLNDE